MLKNYLKNAFRNLHRNKLYSFLNIFGLGLGIAAFLLILQYVSFERSVNGFHKNIGSIYRLLNEDQKGVTWGETEPGWAPRAKQNFPEIIDYCRFETGAGKGVVRREDVNGEPFREENVGYVEGNFFSFFSFPLVKGNINSFKKPNVVFISEPISKKYFGKEEPMGKTLTLSNQFGKVVYTVEGLFNIPENSDIKYDMVFSLETLNKPGFLDGYSWAKLDNLNSQYINTFFQLQPNTNYKQLEQKLIDFRTKLKKDKDGVVFRLQPFTEVHLPSSLNDAYQTLGNLKYIYILSGVAVLILCIAWFNYINLSTAQSLKRAHEVGVRKVLGASRTSLITQFLAESFLFTMLAFVLALLIVQLSQPFFNNLVGKKLSLAILLQPGAWLWGLGLLFIGSLSAGGYTAFSLSRFQPVQTLKGNVTRIGKGVVLRKSLVVAQFSISIVLILATAVIYRQLKFMQNQNLGVQTQQLLVVRGPSVDTDSTYKNRRSAFLNEVAQQNFVQDYSLSGTVPGNFYNFMTSGFTQPSSKKGDEFKPYSFAVIDSRYLNTYQIALKAGRGFTEAETDVDWDANSKVLLNEKGVEELGFSNDEQALRTRIQWDERELEIIGVVKNYHHTGLQKTIDPIIFYPQKNSAYFSIRLQSTGLQANIALLEKMYKKWFANNPFEYFFADENFNKQYLAEKQYGSLFTAASVWAIVIACLGLFGLASFTVQQRKKEIGIRKVLGASVLGIAQLLSNDFLKLVLLAIVIAWPLAWWGMNKWLEAFAYRIQIEWWVFVLAAIASVVIAILTIGYQSVKAAVQNPVNILRSE